MVDAELSFAEAVAAQGQLAVFDEVVGTQVGHAGAEGGFTQSIAMDDPLQAQLVVLAVAGLLEVEVAGMGQGAVLGLAVGVIEVPPAKRQVVIEHRVARGFLVIADRIMAAAQGQLVGQAERVVPIQARPPLLFAGAALTTVVA